jgi:HSP20 family molecular chaperone IbpA
LITTKRMSFVFGALLLVILTTSSGSAGNPGASRDDRGCDTTPTALAVSVSETPEAIVLHVRASGDVEPESVEVRFAGRKAIMLARDAEGRPIRSQPLRLPEPVVEEGSSAGYDADGVLVVTLPKQVTAQNAAPTGEREAAAR